MPKTQIIQEHVPEVKDSRGYFLVRERPEVKSVCATEEELLSFCNQIREAGGAKVLDELLLSEPKEPEGCLIARGLNFGCHIDSDSCDNGDFYADGSSKWYMRINYGSPEQALAKTKEIAEKLKLKVKNLDPYDEHSGWPRHSHEDDWVIALPKHIGNAAHAFDEGLAFQEYNSQLKDLDDIPTDLEA